MHLRQNCLYSEDVIKNPAELLYLNVLLIYQETKVWWCHFCYDVVLKLKKKFCLLGEEKNPKP